MREELHFFWRYVCPISGKRVRTRYQCTAEHAARKVELGEWLNPVTDSEVTVRLVPETKEELQQVLCRDSTSAFRGRR